MTPYIFAEDGFEIDLSMDGGSATLDNNEFDAILSISQYLHLELSYAPDYIPLWSNNRTNDTYIGNGDNVSFSVDWTDDVGLRFIIFENNFTGMFQIM